MRRKKSIQINNELSADVYELSVRDIIDLTPEIVGLADNLSLQAIIAIAPQILSRVTSLSVDQLCDLAFSEIDILEAALREVNKSFLRRCDQGKMLAAKMSLGKIAQKAIDQIIQNIEAVVGQSMAQQATQKA